MEYSTVMVMNELVIQNNMDEFQKQCWVGEGTTHRKIHAVRLHLYSVQKHGKLQNILFRVTSMVNYKE